MSPKLTRFLNLERARKPAETPPHEVATRARFGGEEAPAAAPDFRAERAAQLESGVSLDAHPDAEQPFLRCPVCEADNSRYAVRCLNCQAALDTLEAREWNRRLWDERRRQRAAEPKPHVASELAPDQQRMLREMLAREVAQSERARLSYADSQSPLGMRLLAMIPNQDVRFAVAMGMVAVFFGAGLVAFVAKERPALQLPAIVIAIALLVLFMPNRRRRSRWWDDD